MLWNFCGRIGYLYVLELNRETYNFWFMKTSLPRIVSVCRSIHTHGIPCDLSENLMGSTAILWLEKDFGPKNLFGEEI